MEYIKTRIPEVMLLKPKVFEDERGYFLETFRENQFLSECSNLRFVQDNHSGSKQGTLRGLHYQVRQTQGRLIRAVVGEIFDVAVDIRKESATFGQWVGFILSAQNRYQLWIPPKFAHGFYVLSEWAEILYKATDYYAPEFERSIIWNDPILGIEWPLVDGRLPILSEKDRRSNLFTHAEFFE